MTKDLGSGVSFTTQSIDFDQNKIDITAPAKPAPLKSNAASLKPFAAPVKTNPAALKPFPAPVKTNPVAVKPFPAPLKTNPAALKPFPASVKTNPAVVTNKGRLFYQKQGDGRERRFGL